MLICEGEADTAAALSAGWPAVVGTAGANPGSKGNQALQQLLNGRDCILSPHPDESGRKWLSVVGEILLNVQCDVRYIPANKHDLDDRLGYERDKTIALKNIVENW